MAARKIRPIRVEGNIAYVPLTQGYEAVIDAEDANLANGWNWFAQVDRRRDGTTRNVYAARSCVIGGRKAASFLHRVIMQAPPDIEVDHRDHDGLNNRRNNLRLATREQNARNQRVNQNTARGATYIAKKRKWQAQIKVAGRSIFLGLFLSEADAHAAYVSASAEFHGEFGRTT